MTTVKLSGGTSNMSQHMRRHHPALFGDEGPAPKKAAISRPSATSSASAVPKQTTLFNTQRLSNHKFYMCHWGCHFLFYFVSWDFQFCFFSSKSCILRKKLKAQANKICFIFTIKKNQKKTSRNWLSSQRQHNEPHWYQGRFWQNIPMCLFFVF